MIAMMVTIRTKYDCNLLHKGPNMTTVIEILFSRDLFRNHSHVTLGRISTLRSYLVLFERDCNHIWSVSLPSLQSYLVHFVMKIAIIFSPYCYCHCNHIWCPSQKLLQSYVLQPYMNRYWKKIVIAEKVTSKSTFIPYRKMMIRASVFWKSCF